MKLKMEITPNSEHVRNKVVVCKGKIYIGDDFWETIVPALNDWKIEDYERQWKEGLERIKTHDTSCLVACVQHPKKTPPLINLWMLYKENGKIYIQNGLIFAENYERIIQDKPFNPNTCYDFIQLRFPEVDDDEEDDEISEWVVGL